MTFRGLSSRVTMALISQTQAKKYYENSNMQTTDHQGELCQLPIERLGATGNYLANAVNCKGAQLEEIAASLMTPRTSGDVHAKTRN